MTRGSSTARAAGIVTLVVAGLLGSAYVLGRSLVLDQTPRQSHRCHHERRRTALRRPAQRWRAGRSPERQRKPAGTGPAETGQDGSGRDAGGDNLFGAHATTGTPRLALTFDDGPDPRYTPQVLAMLREFDVQRHVLRGRRERSEPPRPGPGDRGRRPHPVQPLLAPRRRPGRPVGRRDPGRSPAHQRGDPGGGAERADRLVPPAGRRLDVPGGVGGAAARHDPAALVGGSVGLGATRRQPRSPRRC